jgi:aminopeptidase N
VDELWLDESFATFAEILYVEETQGKERAWAEEIVWPFVLVRNLRRAGVVQVSE